MTREQDKDSEFEAYLQGKSALSDVYGDLPPASVPGHLDAAILAEAHRAVSARPGGKPRRTWVFPVSMAASLFIAVIIGTQLRYLLPVAETPQAARSEFTGAGRQPAEMPKAENGTGPAMDKSAAAQAQAERKPAREPERRMLAAAPPAVASAAPRKEEFVSQEAPKSTANASTPAEAEQVAPAAAPVPVLEDQMAPREAQAEARSGTAGMMAKKKTLADVEASPYTAAPAAAMAAAPAAAPPASAPGASRADVASQRPEDWLARIRLLKQQGRLDEAKKELSAFKKRYPDYKVPKELQIP